jgi:hypothetical protein
VRTYIAYCFAEKQGYSKFGSYTGNGSTDGTFVYTGFKPAFVMSKYTTTSAGGEGWNMFDNKRDPFNIVDLRFKQIVQVLNLLLQIITMIFYQMDLN